MAGCSHMCRDEVGKCFECSELTGVPGVEFQARTLRQQAATMFQNAKGCFRSENYFAQRGSAAWVQQWKQHRAHAKPILEAWAALRRLERASRIAAE